MLFERLTVKENLMFYCKLRGIYDNMDGVINDNLHKFNLFEKADSFAADLSGGQKRKL